MNNKHETLESLSAFLKTFARNQDEVNKRTVEENKATREALTTSVNQMTTAIHEIATTNHRDKADIAAQIAAINASQGKISWPMVVMILPVVSSLFLWMNMYTSANLLQKVTPLEITDTYQARDLKELEQKTQQRTEKLKLRLRQVEIQKCKEQTLNVK